jgi:invasion protein IalB
MSMTAHCTSQFLIVGRICRVGVVALALTFEIVALTGSIAAQQVPPKKGAPAPVAAAPNGPQAAWVKLCRKPTVVVKDKEGKDEKKDLNVCLTQHVRLDGNTGMVSVSAAIRQIEGEDKQTFLVGVPLGMLIQPGMRVSIYPKQLWEQAQKNEKIDETKLKSFGLVYTLCHPTGCTAEIEAPPELINELKSSGGLIIFTINPTGEAVEFSIPLTGFDQSYAGSPADNKQYEEARKALLQQIVQRQRELEEQQTKQTEEKKNGAAGTAAPKQQR